ncbi:MAG: hypothetical protein ACLGHC_04565 [Alphaproteobacteria bacterium]
MRFSLVALFSLVLAACTTAPKPVEPAQPVQAPHVPSAILGMTAAQLVQRFGTPDLQIREGDSLKLQFRSDLCVLDAYLYPTGTAPHRVTHVDTRTRALAAIDQAVCIRSLDAP